MKKGIEFMNGRTWILVTCFSALAAACSDAGSPTDTPDATSDRDVPREAGSDRAADAPVSDAPNAPDASDVRDAPNAETSDARDSTDAPDGLTCGQFEVVAYKTPGCGVNAPPPYCQGPTDACLSFVCLCNGQTGGSGCGFSREPFAAWGPCEGGRPDVTPDVTPDGDGSDVFDVTPDVAQDGDGTTGSDGPDAIDVGDAPDGLSCAPPAVVAYNAPGCGASTPAPYCQGPTDACLSFVCLCNGQTGGSGCGYSQEPFAAWGACPDGGVDASSD
jgi:hypothetical protein